MGALTLEQIFERLNTKTEFSRNYAKIYNTSRIWGQELSPEMVKEILAEGVKRGLATESWLVTYRNQTAVKESVADQQPQQFTKLEQHNMAEQTPESIINDDKKLAQFYLNKISSCKSRNIEWQLTLNETRALLKRKTCWYTGNRFVNDGRNHLTLDRIDNKLPYTKENTVACAWWVNNLKCEVLENPKSYIKTDLKTLRKIIAKL